MLLSGSPSGADLPPDVGLVFNVVGKASFFASDQRRPREFLQAFMKIRLGDRISLSPAAKVKLIYFASGRRETWQGPCRLLVHSGQSKPVAPGALARKPQVEQLPRAVTNGISRFPGLMDRSRRPAYEVSIPQTQGAEAAPPRRFRLLLKPPPAPRRRAASPKEVMPTGEGRRRAAPSRPLARPSPAPAPARSLAAAWQTYRRLARSSPPRDVTPEIYLLGELARSNNWALMSTIVNRGLAKQPRHRALRRLRRWVAFQQADMDGKKSRAA